MTFPQRTKEIVIKDNTYKVSFPTNRQFMDIHAKKAQLSKDTYDSLSLSIDGNGRYAALLIDAIATFEVIMPEQFFKDLNIKNIADLDLIQGAELVKVYRDQYEGWFTEWTKAMTEVLKGVQEEKKEEPKAAGE